MRPVETAIPGLVVVEPKVFGDARGFFMESYNRRALAELGLDRDWVQDNHSRSRRHVLRGLHYQLGRPQAKLVRVTAGTVWDVAVDIRRGSATFGRWEAVELSAANYRMLFVPEGFAHGFLVLSDSADFQYKCSDFYAPEEERGLRWDDPGLDIPWPLNGTRPIVSERDAHWPVLAAADPSELPEDTR